MLDPIRHVRFGGHELKLYDTGRIDCRGQSKLAYSFRPIDGEVLFEGDDFAGSPLHADDSDETLRSLVGFLTLRPGDTDREYFADYTPEQLALCRSGAEYLSLWADAEFGEEFEEVES